MVEDEQLIRFQCKLGVCLPRIVGELDFVRAVEDLHHSAHLASHESVLRQIVEQRNDIEPMWAGVHDDVLSYVAACQPRKIFARPNNPDTSDSTGSTRAVQLKVYHVTAPELVNSDRHCVFSNCCFQERNTQHVGILDSQTECR